MPRGRHAGLVANYPETGKLFDSPDATQAPIPIPTGVSAAELVKNSYLHARSLAEAARQHEMQARHDVYEDDFRDEIEKRLKTQYEQENAKELTKVLDTTNNPLKRIVNEISTLYTRAPVWKFNEASASSTWREILEGANAGVFFPELNRLVNLLNNVLVFVRPHGDTLSFKMIMPYDATVGADPDDPSMPLAVMFRECDANSPNSLPRYHMWDRRPGMVGYRLFDEVGNPVREATNGTNPYEDEHGPVIPICAYHRRLPKPGSFWDQTSGDDLYELTIMLALWETWINHLFRTDSFMQKWTGGLIDAQGSQRGGPTAIMNLRSPDGSPVNVGEF
jgi:hypothetical protein